MSTVLAKMAVLISAQTADFNKQLNAARKDLNAFSGSIKRIGATLGVALGVDQLKDFTLEVSRLAGQADGVTAAFKRLPNSVELMEELKKATGGTVSELELMKRAVQASNFDISLEALPRLLEFATLRAQQTGQSVDYLVDSIVTGIGRKSKLILDNLGISAVALSEKLKGVSTDASTVGDVAKAVGQIAEESLAKMAGFSENASTKVDRLAASWDNLRVNIGRVVNNSFIPDFFDKLNKDIETVNEGLEKGISRRSLDDLIELFNDSQPKGKLFLDLYKRIEEGAAKLGLKLIELSDDVSGVVKLFVDTRGAGIKWAEGTDEAAGKLVETYQQLVDKKKTLDEQFEEATDRNDKKALANIGAQIIAVQKLIAELDALRTAKKDPLAGKFQFIPDIEAEESLNLELRNDQAEVELAKFQKTLADFTKSGELAGGAFIQLENDNKTAVKGMEADWAAAGGAFVMFGDQVVGVFSQTQKAVLDYAPVIHSALSGIGQALGEALMGAGDLSEKFLGVLGGILVQLGEMLITAGLGVEAFKESLTSGQGAIAIAAGVALIAIGTAVSQGMKSLGEGYGSGGSSVSSGSKIRYAEVGQRIELYGELVADGQNLKAIITNQDRRDDRIKRG